MLTWKILEMFHLLTNFGLINSRRAEAERNFFPSDHVRICVSNHMHITSRFIHERIECELRCSKAKKGRERSRKKGTTLALNSHTYTYAHRLCMTDRHSTLTVQCTLQFEYCNLYIAHCNLYIAICIVNCYVILKIQNRLINLKKGQDFFSAT